MPELPEVATIAGQLNKTLPLKIQKIWLSDVADSIVHTPMTALKNKTLYKIERKGKMLIFRLTDDLYLLSHLGMTGTWRLDEKACHEKHKHIILSGLNEKNQKINLTYVDPRRFGHAYLLDQALAQKKLAELGMDLADKKFDLDYLTFAITKYPNRMLKVTLLDQSLFAGSGNYIANEICAHARILPTRLCKDIKKSELEKILNATRLVITGAIKQQGTTFQGGYQDAFGNKGEGVNNLVVFYQKICRLCHKTPVIKVTLAQRGTYYCPQCQK
jgi:formamidopyrimidine-DNA glycosylase